MREREKREREAREAWGVRHRRQSSPRVLSWSVGERGWGMLLDRTAVTGGGGACDRRAV